MITRFAPSPTGPLHLGHAFSAIVAHDLALSKGGTFLLRIEDIDQSRARDKWVKQIFEDLAWLGLHWPEPVWHQSNRQEHYDQSLDRLWDAGLLFVCKCSRRDIIDALDAPQEGKNHGPDGVIYPGTCRAAETNGPRPKDQVLRLNMSKAATQVTYRDIGDAPGKRCFEPDFLINRIGDVVLARRDMGTSYHLSVVIDDAAQKVSHVVRGIDLADATPIHVLLQQLLGLPTPTYLHHQLIRDENGKRLAKRDDARAIASYRAEGATPNDIRRMIGLPEA